MERGQEPGSGQQRASFSAFLETHRAVPAVQEEEGSSGSSSGEFEFRNPFSVVEEEEDSTSGFSFPADELFYNGKMLPLEPLSRMAMVKDLNAVVRRGGSAPPSPYFDPCSGTAGGTRGKPSTTRKSSSYPPRNRGSRRFKDFFGALKKNNSYGSSGQDSSQAPIKPPVSSTSSASSSSSNKFFRNVLNFGRREAGKGQVSNPSLKQQSQMNQQQNPMNVAAIGRRNRVLSAADFTRSAPATPLHPRAAAAAGGFAPVLHLPLPRFLSHKTIEAQ